MNRLKAALSIGQTNRLLQLETALPSATLVVERAEWHEDTSGLGPDPQAAPLAPLVAEVDCLSTSAHLPLKVLVGEQMSLRLMCADGRYRTWHGYVARAAQLGAESVDMVYRRGAGDMSGYEHEMEAARKEGVRFVGNRVPISQGRPTARPPPSRSTGRSSG